ncbi:MULTISPECIES: type II toxin-antitoxin system HicA family toxin [unclassified Microbacterium]|uniref:type II toxin-antitoxin system HicA family toxin n=1 Tax=unclassified Microbacterium TaxID=2609290 RepID=UPI001AC43064|nr:MULTISPECIES: type II toxin-antitoxin system HicA family toxin [unclassified Microbacterium]MBN9215359.1 type II toxin-antitoxin system HicA family toxin [Microbacterium sp.]
MKEAKRSDVERFLRSEGYRVTRDSGPHTWWSKEGARSVPLPRHTRISPGVLRSIERIVGHVPPDWK